MIELKFGVPTQKRTKKEEKYPNLAVITMHAWGGKGTSKKFELNPKASIALGVEEDGDHAVAVSFAEGNIYIVKATGEEDENYKLTKGTPRSFSNSRVYDYFQKFLSLDNTKDNEFILEQVEGADYNGGGVFILNKVVEGSATEESVAEILENNDPQQEEESVNDENILA